VVVQSAPATAETRYLLDIVRDLPWVYGVVGWIDLERDDVADVCAALRSTGPLVGVRVMLNRIADERWIARPAVRRGLEALAAADLSLDLLAEPRHIAYMRQALISVPDLRAIINHGATPPIAAGSLEPWASSLAELARDTSAWCKFSALREVAGADVSDARILPYARQILSAFGTRRLLWASNWPVCNLAGGFAAWWASAHALLDQLERKRLQGGVSSCSTTAPNRRAVASRPTWRSPLQGPVKSEKIQKFNKNKDLRGKTVRRIPKSDIEIRRQ
jgi:L-fuconolactonase